jgi:monovalent cation:H+ antiporter-2, CPA2 family
MERISVLLPELGAVFFPLSMLGLLARSTGLSTIPFTQLAGLTLGEGGLPR